MSTFEAIQASRFTIGFKNIKDHIINRTLELQTLDRPVIHSEVEIFTPRSLSPAPSFEFTTLESNTDSTVDILSLRDFLYSCADHTPWLQFTQFLAVSSIESQHMAMARITQDYHPEHVLLIVPAKVQEIFVNILMSLYIDLGSEYGPSPALVYPRLYLPSSRYDASRINPELLFNLPSRDSQLELLKYTVYLISNNFTGDLIHTVIELTRERQNLDFFIRLQKHNLCSVNAFSEKLLMPAARSWNFTLMEMLLDLGVGTKHLYSTDVLLRSAVEANNETAVINLLARGANHESRDTRLGYGNFSILEIAILQNSLNIVACLLQYPPGIINGCIKIREEAFVVAAFQGNINILNLLVSKQPDMFETLKQTPWLLLEPASLSGSFAMLETLRTSGFDICATDILGNGSPLVFAALHGHTQLVEYLLEAGAKIDSYGYGTAVTELGSISARSFHMKGQLWPSTSGKRMGAIHAAISYGDETLVRNLLSKGANPDQPGFMYPIQLATSYGDMRIVQVLLEWGADPNTVFPPDSSYPGHYPCLECPYGCPQTRPILIALQNGDQGLFETLLEAGGKFPIPSPNPCQHDEIHWNPLLSAIQGDNKKLFSRVLEVSHTHSKQWITHQCLAEFAQTFDWAFVTEPIEKQLFPPDICYQQPILSLCITGNADGFMEDLIRNQKLQPNDAGVAFIKASRYGKEYLVRLFLEHGYWPDEFFKMRFGDYCINVLYDKGAESWRVAMPNRGSWDFSVPAVPLVEAFQSKNEAIINLMLNHYENLSDKAQQPNFSRRFMQAYGIAIRYGDMRATEMLASKIGVDFVSHKELGSHIWVDGGLFPSSVQLAAYFNHYDIVQWLLDHNANPNIPDEEIHDNTLYHSPLLYAVRSGEILVIKKLLEKGANVNTRPIKNNGATALQMAAISGRFDILDLLIEAGADINAHPGAFEGRSAIEGAAEWGRLDMTRYLLNAGAGAGVLGKQNRNYRRAVYRAWKHDHYELAYMIHRWKKENDKGYLDTCDSIEAILRTTEPETLICAEGYKLEQAGWAYRPSICGICVPQV